MMQSPPFCIEAVWDWKDAASGVVEGIHVGRNAMKKWISVRVCFRNPQRIRTIPFESIPRDIKES